MSSQEVPRAAQQERSILSGIEAGFEFNRKNFDNPALEWRRLFSEVLGTFLLVLAGAGGGVVNAVSNGIMPKIINVNFFAMDGWLKGKIFMVSLVFQFFCSHSMTRIVPPVSGKEISIFDGFHWQAPLPPEWQGRG